MLCSLSPFFCYCKNGRQAKASHTDVDCQSVPSGGDTAISISRPGDTNWQTNHTRTAQKGHHLFALFHQSNDTRASVSMETCPRSMFEFDQNAYGSWSGPGSTYCNNSAPQLGPDVEGINGSFMLAFVGNDSDDHSVSHDASVPSSVAFQTVYDYDADVDLHLEPSFDQNARLLRDVRNKPQCSFKYVTTSNAESIVGMHHISPLFCLATSRAQHVRRLWHHRGQPL